MLKKRIYEKFMKHLRLDLTNTRFFYKKLVYKKRVLDW